MPKPQRSSQLRARRTPRQERAAVTVEAILEAAAQVFEQHGYAAGTTNRIAERAGVSVGSLYQYFPNKDAILVALMEQHLDEGAALVAPTLAAVFDAPRALADELLTLANTLADLHRARPGLHRVLFEEAPRPADVRARIDALEEAAVAGVALWLGRHPEVQVDDPQLAARLVAQTLEATTHRIVIHPPPGVDPEGALREACVMLERYLSPSRPPGSR